MDGLLQLKPAMFTAAFTKSVLMPNFTGQPHWAQLLFMPAIHMWMSMPIMCNWMAVVMQVAIGALILVKIPSWERAGLILSIGWGLLVWVFGEGFGMFLTSFASFVTGTPGSVFFYLLAAALLLVPAKNWRKTVAYSRLQWMLAGLWSVALIWQIRLAFEPRGMLSESFQQNLTAMPTPWLTHVVNTFALTAAHHPIDMNLAIMAGLAVFTGLWLFPRPATWAIYAAVGWWAIWWVGGMDLGLWGATATDPNSAPLWILLLLALKAAEPSTLRTPLEIKDGQHENQRQRA